MLISVTNPGPAQVVGLNGRLNQRSVPKVRSRLNSLLREVGAKARLVLDLQGVDYISAGGIQTILHLAREVNRLEGRLVLCGLGGYADDILKTARITDLLPVCPDQEAALREF